MLEAKELNKFRVTLIEAGKENDVNYFPNTNSVLEYIQDLKNISTDEENFDHTDAIHIEKLAPLDYFPTEFTNLNEKKENLWLGTFVHFHDLPNTQNVKGTLYARRFIVFTYDNGFDPIKRTERNYIAHMFLPASNSSIKAEEFKIDPITITIHSTDAAYNDLGIVSTTLFPLSEVYKDDSNLSYEDIMNIYIQKFADMYNPYSYFRTQKND